MFISRFHLNGLLGHTGKRRTPLDQIPKDPNALLLGATHLFGNLPCNNALYYSTKNIMITDTGLFQIKEFAISYCMERNHSIVWPTISTSSRNNAGERPFLSTLFATDLESLTNDRIGLFRQLLAHLRKRPVFINAVDDREIEEVYATSPAHKSGVGTMNILQVFRRSAQTMLNAIIVAWRSAEIVIRFSPLLVLAPTAALFDSTSTHGNSCAVAKKSWNATMGMFFGDLAWTYTLHTIQSLGPAFIKISQWAATRQDIFPRFFCARLSKLHDSAYIHSWVHSESLLIKTFGKDYEDWLRVYRNEVIGSGSVAQVYRGWYSRDGIEKEVAVKVLHPNIERRIERDLSLMQRISHLLHVLPSQTIQMMNIPRVTNNFSKIMRQQIDLRNEGNNLDEFRKNFGTASASNHHATNGATGMEVPLVTFPNVIVAEKNCLVEDFEDALPISHFLQNDSPEGMQLRRQLARPLLRSFLKMVFMDNFIHSDLHQGNIKVKTTKVQTQYNADGVDEKYTIVFLDAGIVTTLSSDDQRNLKDLFKAVIMNNGEEAGRLMVERAKYERCSEIEGGIEQFAQGMSEIVQEFHDRRRQGLTLGTVKIASLISRVLDLCRTYSVEVDPAMSNIVMSTLVLEGLGRSLDADVNLFDIALPFVLGRGKI